MFYFLLLFMVYISPVTRSIKAINPPILPSEKESATLINEPKVPVPRGIMARRARMIPKRPSPAIIPEE